MKKFLICLLFTAAVLNLSAYDVDREELESNKQEVEFINFTGIHDKIDSRKEIYSIGTSLGHDIKGNSSSSLSGKYRVLHLVDPSEPEKMGADLFILEKHAGVDHIRNLRLILSGYLKTAYGYTESDASLLAEFVTYYNAVFRGKMDFFESKYNNMVLTNITAENAGIDINYKNWPGKTRMVIPLKNGKAGESSLSAKELSEEEVIEDLRKNEDKGIEPRKEMVELREKELDKELEKASDKEDVLVADKEKAEKEKEKVEDEIKELEEKKSSGELTEDKYKEEKKELEEKKDEIVKQEEDLEKEIEKVKAEAAAVEEEKAEIAEERESIASDTNKLLENEEVPEDTSSVTGSLRQSTETFFIAVLSDSDGKYGELLLIDNKTGKAGEKSDIKKIGIRGVSESSSSSIFLAGSDNGAEYFLMKVDTNTLEVKARSEIQVYRDTVISEKGGALFAVVDESGTFRIGKFSSDLVLESSSDEAVLEDTFVFHDLENKKLYFQNSSGDIKSVDSSSLKASE